MFVQVKEEHGQATRDRDATRREVEDINKLLGGDFGPGDAFMTLQGQCFTSPVQGDYTYEMCPFKDASQKPTSGSSTSIGRWEGWAEGHTQMLFKNGAHCWQGPSRQLTVTLQCATETRLLSVAEPSVCVYTATLETPLVCSAEEAKSLRLELENN